MRSIALKSLFVTCALAVTFPADALCEPSAQFMAVGLQVPPPRGYLEFCARDPSECPEFAANSQAQPAPDTMRSLYWKLLFSSIQPGSLKGDGTPKPRWSQVNFTENSVPGRRMLLSVTPALWRNLNRVNQDVNHSITPRSDMAVYGVEDYWAEPLKSGIRYGDCEDYVLEKRRALLKLGYPTWAFSIALVRTRWRENHAVLLVNTDQGEYVLDSLSANILPWHGVDYRWLSRQSPLEATSWVSGPPTSFKQR